MKLYKKYLPFLIIILCSSIQLIWGSFIESGQLVMGGGLTLCKRILKRVVTGKLIVLI